MSKIFIGCSASNDIDDIYTIESKKIIDLLSNNTLVFGGYDSGIMGLAYHSFKESIAVIPKISKSDIDDLDCTKIMTKYSGECTDNLIINSDIILFLPGGVGTLMEIFTAIHMKKINEIDKPIIIYNINGFYDDMLKTLDDLYLKKFINVDTKDLYQVRNNAEDIIDAINREIGQI